MASPTELCENRILSYLSTSDTICIDDTYPWSIAQELDPLIVIGAVQSLLSEQYVTSQDLSTTFYTLTSEGEFILENGSQEMIVYNTIKTLSNTKHGNTNSPITMEDIETTINNKDICKIGFGNCLKNKWITKQGNEYTIVSSDTELLLDTVQIALRTLSEGDGRVEAIDDKVQKSPMKSCSDCRIPLFVSNSCCVLIPVRAKRLVHC
jgi:phenylalanyl-tRNA synthetase alpha chain